MIEVFKDIKEVQVIIFGLGKEEYAVPIMNVQEIIVHQDPTQIPGTPEFVEGVINLRGRIIPIIDGRRKFRLEYNLNSFDSRIIILDVNHEIVGLVVDAVSEVIHLDTEDIESPPIDNNEESLLWGLGKFQNRLLILINPEKFLTHTEAKVLEKLAIAA